MDHFSASPKIYIYTMAVTASAVVETTSDPVAIDIDAASFLDANEHFSFLSS